METLNYERMAITLGENPRVIIKDLNVSAPLSEAINNGRLHNEVMQVDLTKSEWEWLISEKTRTKLKFLTKE